MRLNYQHIRQIVPHRYPLLLVDQVLDINSSDSIVGIKAVTATEFCYSHLEDDSLIEAYSYPVSLMIESFGQTGGVLINKIRKEKKLTDENTVMLAAGCTNFHVLADVYPGDTMEHHVTLDKIMDDFVLISGVIKVGEQVVAEVETMIVAFRNKNDIG